MNSGTWINGTKKVTGHWEYHWPSDSFVIWLNSKDRVTGEQRRIVTRNDTPEWGNWRLQK